MDFVVGKLTQFGDGCQLLGFEGRCVGFDGCPGSWTCGAECIDGGWSIDGLVAESIEPEGSLVPSTDTRHQPDGLGQLTRVRRRIGFE